MSDTAPKLIVQPDDGLEPVREFIESAQTSLLIKQFTFTEPSLVEATIDRKNAGVDVRVMLNAKRSGGDRANDDTYGQLRAAGVDVQWSNPKFYVTHEKSIVVDGNAAMVATYNLMLKYFTVTRDYGIITYDPGHVAQIIDVFEADWDHRDISPDEAAGLLWSNSNSRYQMARFIDKATSTLQVQHPKYVDAVILDHIAAATDRGVKVHVLCGGRHGISDWGGRRTDPGDGHQDRQEVPHRGHADSAVPGRLHPHRCAPLAAAAEPRDSGAGKPDLGLAEGTHPGVKTYLSLLSMFGTLSLLSIGGGNAVLPEMHMRAVRGYHWLTDSQFADIFSISQAAPGPSILIVSLVGYAAGLQVASVAGGLIGGVVATVAMIVPAAMLMYLVTMSWQRAMESKLRHAVEKGFAPLTVGLILATSLVMSRAADHDWRAYLLTGVATVIFVRTGTNPLIMVAAAAVLGYLGFV